MPITPSANPRLIVLTAILTIATAVTALPQTIPFAGQIKTNDGPTITFTDTTVSCSGLSPGDSVALVGFVIDHQSGSQTITTPSISQQADSTGAFSTTIPGGVKPRSIWLLIDETAVSYTVAAPQGSVLRQLPEGAVALSGGPNSSGIITINRAHTHVISISVGGMIMESRSGRIKATDLPGDIYVFDAKDGSGADDDGTIDGVVHLVVPNFMSSSQDAAYLFIVDDRTLEFRALHLEFNHNQFH